MQRQEGQAHFIWVTVVILVFPRGFVCAYLYVNTYSDMSQGYVKAL
jgi:hypothetical protein